MKPIDLVAIVLLGGVVVGGVAFVVTRRDSPAPAAPVNTGPTGGTAPGTYSGGSSGTAATSSQVASDLAATLAKLKLNFGSSSGSSGGKSSGGGGLLGNIEKVAKTGGAVIDAIGKLGIF